MVKVDWARIEPAVFLSSAGVVLLVLGFGVADPARAKDLFLGLQDWIVGTWSWLFIGSTTLFLVFSIWCTFGARADVLALLDPIAGSVWEFLDGGTDLCQDSVGPLEFVPIFGTE